MASLIHVANETRSQSSRFTKENKKITYQMHVIQQPERARACGSGAKSSSDRRPVDPPPIVELRVLEGDADITFSYNANFFLFATLENARTMAQGRVPPAQPTFPVLTGTPVAGMAYLDRPQPAGYFIFPDLSVRHEGKYRLSFALYEEVKEDKDRDPENPQSADPQFPHNGAHVSHRLEVKSAPFTVFSAKKFPGLTESTALSRMVAEQGCRVRIRRDVRMRRRENKGAPYSDEFDEEAGFDRARASATPDVYNQPTMGTPRPSLDGSDRPRSTSNASNQAFGVPPQRRTSVQDLAAQYNQQAYPAHIAPQTPSYNNQMPYAPAQQHQYQHAYPQQQQSMMPPQAPYQQPQHSYAPPPPQQQQQQQQQQMAQAYGYMQPHQYAPQQQFPEPGQHMRHNSMEYPSGPQYRSASIQQSPNSQYPAHPQPMAPFGTLDTPFNRAQQMGQPAPSMTVPQVPSNIAPSSVPSANGQALAPLKMPQPSMDKFEPNSPYGMSAPNSSVSESMAQEYHGNPITAPPTFGGQPQPSGATKRSFSATFDTHHIERPLRQGQRPDMPQHPDDYKLSQYDAAEEEDYMDPAAAMAAMSYRRADGTERRRRVPVNT